MILVDASVKGDEASLSEARDGLVKVAAYLRGNAGLAGRALGLLDTADWGLRRVGPAETISALDPDGHAYRFLVAVAAREAPSNKLLSQAMRVDETEVSRLGRRLLGMGLVRRARLGRTNSWELTGLGQRSLGLAQAALARRSGVALVVDNGAQGTIAVGVDILPTKLVGVVTTASGEVLERFDDDWRKDERPLPAQVASFVGEALSRFAGKHDITATGAALGGHVDANAGRIVFAPKYGQERWDGVTAEALLGEQSRAARSVVNDASALLLYELTRRRRVGDRTAEEDLLVVLIGETGVGAAFASGGRPVEGVRGGAGEIGHIVVHPGGRRCSCNKRGCLEAYASTRAICDAVGRLLHTEIKDIHQLAEYVDVGDADAAREVRNAGRALGIGLASTLNLLNSRSAMVYGPAGLITPGDSRVGQLFSEALLATCHEHAYSSYARDCIIDLAELPSDAIAVGAGIFALAHAAAIHPHGRRTGPGAGTIRDRVRDESTPAART